MRQLCALAVGSGRLFGGTEKSKVLETGLCVGKNKLPSIQIDFILLHQFYSVIVFLKWM
jgi:hypothetical protein